MSDIFALNEMLETVVNDWFSSEQDKLHICDGTEDGSVNEAIANLIDACDKQLQSMIKNNMRSLELTPEQVRIISGVMNYTQGTGVEEIRNKLKELGVE